MKIQLSAAFRSLKMKKTRTRLTICSIAVGVMMVAVLSVLGDAGTVFIDRELEQMGMNGLSVTSAAEDGLSQRALAGIRELHGVETAMPLIISYTDMFLLDQKQESLLCGIDAGADQVISLSLLHGRLITHGDVSAASRVCVVDEEVAKKTYGRQNIVGKTIEVSVNGTLHPLTVVGVTETGSSILQNVATMIPGMVYLPYTTHQELTGREGFDQIAVQTVTGRSESTKRQIQSTLERLSDGNVTYRTENLAAQKARLTRLVTVVRWLLAVLGAVSLVVSGIGIMTVMLSSVGERTKEIGVKKAIGATRGRILSEFLSEAILLSLGGGILGLIPALLLTMAFRLFGVAVPISPLFYGGVLLFSVLIGCIFGGYPAYKAANLPPVEALRSE